MIASLEVFVSDVSIKLTRGNVASYQRILSVRRTKLIGFCVKARSLSPIKKNQASSNITHSAFDTEWITMVGRDGQEVSVLCTYDSFASQSSISLRKNQYSSLWWPDMRIYVLGSSSTDLLSSRVPQK